MRTGLVALALVSLLAPLAVAQQAKQAKQKKKQPEFRWVNPLPENKRSPGLTHATFKSPSMKVDVGYCIYHPPGYDDAANKEKRYPVVYYLHGGRPGNETKSVSLAVDIHQAMKAGKVPPAIYVFVNGGRVSHYNTPDKDSLGEDVFIKELIPHIDATYRTIAERRARGLEGFSQGGRGTARILFRYPELFCSAAPGGGGFATEKRISENDGEENPSLKFLPGHNAYDRARKYAARDDKPQPAIRILVFVGTKGFNYENNLAYMKFLESIEIPFERLIVPDAKHSAREIYQKNGLEIMQFHAKNFERGDK